jgi:predicted porin
MKKVLLGTTALLGVGLLAGTASASDGVKLSLGGYITNQFGVAFDDDSNGELGDNINAVGVGTDAEIYFVGSVTLDNGVTVGARFDLEGGDENNDQIDQAYAYFKGGFGDIRIGSQAGAAGNMYMLPPGSTANFGPYSPNTTGSAVSPGLFDPEGAIAQQDKSQKLVYYSPNFGGFSFGVSYTPDDDEKDYNNGDNADGSFRATGNDGVNDAQNNFGFGVHYDYEGNGWGLSAGGAAYFEGDIQEKAAGDDEAQGYNAGLNLSFGGLTVGAAGTFFNDASGKGNDAWGVAGGLSYNVDAWTVGAGYAFSKQEGFLFGDALTGGDDITVQRAGFTGSYAMGPGIDLDAGVFYTWTGGSADEVDGVDADYDSVEFSVGSSIKF